MKKLLNTIEELGKESIQNKMDIDGVDSKYENEILPLYREFLSKAKESERDEILDTLIVLSSSRFKDYEAIEDDVDSIISESRDVEELKDMKKLSYSLNSFNRTIKRMRVRLFEMV